MFALNKQRHGKKHYVRVVKVAKDYSWRKVMASFVLKVGVFFYRFQVMSVNCVSVHPNGFNTSCYTPPR